MDDTVEILLVEDNPDDAQLLGRQLARSTLAHAVLVHVDHLAAALARLTVSTPTIILLDLTLPDTQRLSALSQLVAAAPDAPIVILTGLDDENLAVEAMKLGAQDYLVKDHLPPSGLARTLRQAIERKQLVVALAAAIRAQESEFSERRQAEQESERLRSALDRMAEGVQIIGPDWRYVYLNDAAANQGRRPKHDLIGQTMQAVYPGIEQTPLFDSLRRCMERRIPEHFENQFTFPNGTTGWFDLSLQPIPDGIFILSTDITARKLAEQALTEANERLTVSLAELGQRGRELALLSQMSEMLQLCLNTAEAGAVVAQFAAELFPSQGGALYLVHGPHDLVDDAARWGPLAEVQNPAVFMPSDCWALRRGQVQDYPGSQGTLICRHVSQDGLPAPRAYTCVPIVAQGKTLGILHLRQPPSAPPAPPGSPPPGSPANSGPTLASAVAEHLALALANLSLRESLREQSIRDPLTGLFNRQYLEETLDREFQRAGRQAKPVGIILADIDHFQAFNAARGREAGDAVLRALGALLQQRARGEDIACRFGGEEFALVLSEMPQEEVVQRAEQLLVAAHQLQAYHHDQRLDPITLSAGVAVFPTHGLAADTLLEAALSALTAAQRAGPNQVRVAEA